jgi:hypothetical protein
VLREGDELIGRIGPCCLDRGALLAYLQHCRVYASGEDFRRVH